MNLPISTKNFLLTQQVQHLLKGLLGLKIDLEDKLEDISTRAIYDIVSRQQKAVILEPSQDHKRIYDGDTKGIKYPKSSCFQEYRLFGTQGIS